MSFHSNQLGTSVGNGWSAVYPSAAEQNGRRAGAATDDTAPRFGTNSLVRDLGHDTFLRIGHLFRRVSLEKEQYLYQQDDLVEYIYFPETAVVSEFQIAEDGRTIEVSIVGSEGAVGVAAAFNSYRAANCIQVCIPGTALAIGREVLERAVMADPRLHFKLHSFLNGQIKQLSQKVVCNTFHSVEQRFCTWLLTLQKRSRREKFRLTHEHVAKVLGVHRPSVTCIAQGLRDRKLIDYGRARLVIRDRRGLERLACRCSADVQLVEAEH